MLRRILETIERVAEIRAEARIEAAKIEARSRRWCVRARLGMLPKPEAEPDPVPPELGVFDSWLSQHLPPGPMRDDARGMMEAVLGMRDTTPEKRRVYIDRLLKMGAPMPGETRPSLE